MTVAPAHTLGCMCGFHTRRLHTLQLQRAKGAHMASGAPSRSDPFARGSTCAGAASEGIWVLMALLQGWSSLPA